MQSRNLMLIGASVAMADLRMPRCPLKVDLAVVQDTTGSYFDSLRNLTGKLPGLVADLTEAMPGTRMSVGEFRDKPYVLLGDADGFCYRQRTKGFTRSSDEVDGAYAALWGTGGGDLPEAQLEALVRVAYDRESLPWCTSVGVQDEYAEDECTDRVVVLITDAVPHDFDDYTLYNGADPAFPPAQGSPIPPYYMPPFPDTGLAEMSSADWDHLCVTNEYPRQDQFVQAYKDAGIVLIQLITPQSQKVADRWAELNEALGQSQDLLQLIDANSTVSFLNGFEAAMNSYTESRCPGSTRPPLTTHLTSSTQLVTSTRPTTKHTTTTAKPATTTTITASTKATTTPSTTTTPTTTAKTTTTPATTPTPLPSTSGLITSTDTTVTTKKITAATTTASDDVNSDTTTQPHCRWPTTTTKQPDCVWPKK